MLVTEDRLLSIKETSNIIGVNPQTLRRWDYSGKLVAFRINDRGDRRYKLSDIKRTLKDRPRKDKLKVVSLFSGCGGMDLGFRGGFTFLGEEYPENDFEIVYANDIYKNACETYKLNFKSNHVVCGDFTEIVKEPDQIPDCDVILGGFPCQDFSVAGKRRGLEVERGRLYSSMVRLVEAKRPKAFLAENVKGLLNIDKGEVIKIIESDFASIGYEVTVTLFNAADYGVPEIRERVIICGIRKDLGKKFTPPPPTHFNPKLVNASGLEKLGLRPWVTAKQALKDLEKKSEGEFVNHFWSKAKLTPGTQGNTVIAANRPGPTIRAEHHGNIEFHYSLGRRLSAREAARIQSFPDDFEFFRSTSDAYKQVGNAVAPVFAWHLANSLQKVL